MGMIDICSLISPEKRQLASEVTPTKPATDSEATHIFCTEEMEQEEGQEEVLAVPFDQGVTQVLESSSVLSQRISQVKAWSISSCNGQSSHSCFFVNILLSLSLSSLVLLYFSCHCFYSTYSTCVYYRSGCLFGPDRSYNLLSLLICSHWVST